ncbi:hypothetical protein UA08_08903 [Talaromyces atroroseus]|uniref:Uncharacterized protein n=1 Tax=Talaromyces atroroseus TaxID=1441469 RepID=A0A225AQW6_TALAT|nr:hypothetical protein UA08_08903 [Talaromyces atroroseus]OKL55847.1 hypothetical protein UA08_08903 [Talaromyces atroroseus]
MSYKRAREEARAELLISSSLPKRPKASSSSLAETSTIVPQHKVDEDNSDDSDDDYTSSSGTSSSEDDDEDEDEEVEAQGKHDGAREEKTTQNRKIQDHSPKSDNESITYVPGRPKPKIQRIQLPRPDDESGLMSRLSSFLPQLQAANADLERRLASGGNLQDMVLDDVREGEGQYIEMNLGLGVLKEKKKKTGILDNESTSTSDSDEVDDDEHPEDAEGSDGHVMDQLMGLGNRSQKTKPGIQEFDDG